MTASQRERVRRIRERAVIRAWEYRQREHAGGVWFRLRRVLVDAARAFVITEADADQLEQLGALPVPVGCELSPAKRLFSVTPEQLETLTAREVPVRLTAELLRATALALVAHADASGRTQRSAKAVECAIGAGGRAPATRPTVEPGESEVPAGEPAGETAGSRA